MKKTFITFIAFLVVVACAIISCDKNQENRSSDSDSDGRTESGKNGYVTMQALPEEGMNDLPIKLKIENHTKEKVTYNQTFLLEYFNGIRWIPVELNVEFEDIVKTLNAGEIAEQQVYLPIGQYDCKAGKYRINKEVASEKKTYNLSAEFEIDQATIDLSKMDFSNIENLGEQPLEVIQKCVQGEWQVRYYIGGFAGKTSTPDNLFVKINNNKLNDREFQWKEHAISDQISTYAIIWLDELGAGGLYFGSIEKDTLIVGYISDLLPYCRDCYTGEVWVRIK